MNPQIEILIQLQKENPELEIICMVDNEVCCGDEHTYWKGEISSIIKEVYFDEPGYILIGKEAIKDYYLDALEEDPRESQFPEIEKIRKVELLFDTLKLKEAIFIYIGV